MPRKDLDERSKKFAGEPAARTGSSRSTSRGSLCSASSQECGNLTANQSCQGNDLPAFEYPAPFTIRNTFIDTGILRPVSLEEFYQERLWHSEPVDAARGSIVEEMDLTVAAQLQQVMGSMKAASEAAAVAMRGWMQTPSIWPQISHSSTETKTQAAPVLSLANLIEEPTLGSAEMPTLGSAAHASGACKPCAFLHTRGCSNGTNCNFCHLCPAGEKKRRQKEKYGVMREMRRMGM